MMLSKDQAERLKVLGFYLPNSQLERHQQIWWLHNVGPFVGETYCTGGRLSSNAPTLASPILQKHGLWLPTVSELLLWLELKGFSLDIRTNPNTELSNITAQHPMGHKYRVHAETVETALFLIIVQILESDAVPDFRTYPKSHRCLKV